MDFNLSEQEKMLQRLAKDFAIEAVPPYCEPFDIGDCLATHPPLTPSLKGRCLDSHFRGNDMGERGVDFFGLSRQWCEGGLGGNR